MQDSYCSIVRHARGRSEWSERTYQRAKVIPNLGDVWVETNRAGICIQSVAVLVNLIVQYTDGAPKRRVSAITIYRLLVSLVRFWVLLL